MKFPSLICLLFLVTTTACFSEIVEPESVGMSSERLAQIGPMIDRFIERKSICGMVTLVARRGSIVHLEAHGKFSDDREDALTTDAIFGLASLTKTIVHVAAMMLVEEGALRLDDPVFHYILAFKDAQVKLPSGELASARQPIRIHHLLRHTSGVSGGDKRRSEFSTIEDYIRYRAEQPLLFHPGERYKYDESTEILGWVIEKVSRMSLRLFLKERIFEPLGMEDTDFGIPAQKKDREAQLFMDGKSDPTRGGRRPHGIGISDYFDARAGLFSTAEDYWRFCQMLLNEGEFEGKRLISKDTLQHMLAVSENSPDLPGWRREDSQMTLGFRVITKSEGSSSPLSVGPLSVGSYFKSGGFGTFYFVDPSKELIGIYLDQQYPRFAGMGQQFQQLVYESIAD